MTVLKSLEVRLYLSIHLVGVQLVLCIQFVFWKSEQPSVAFIIVSVEGLEINDRTNPRNKEVAYVCFMKKYVNQLHFIDWFDNNVTYSTVVTIRKKKDTIHSTIIKNNTKNSNNIYTKVTNSFYGEIMTSLTSNKW